MKKTSLPLLGAHISTSGGASTAIDRALSIACNAMQIFVKNNMQWFAPTMSEKEAGGFCDHPKRAEVKSVFGHSGYMINLAASNPEFHAKSVRALREELVRADQLQLPFLVLHPGAHTGAGEEAGLEKVVSSLDEVFAALRKIKTRVALETTAGQGSCLGHKFEHLAFILANVREPERLCVCIDTAHLFAAGYDLTSAPATKKTFGQFNKIVGLRWLAAIHMNDSKTPRGSHVDRHEHIGKGQIGLKAFRYIMNESAFAKIPKVLETPKEKAMLEDVENLRTLRGLIR